MNGEKKMANWTEHTKLSFHVEGCESPEMLLKAVSQATGLELMYEEYVGSWKGVVTKSAKFTHIAQCHKDIEAVFPILNETLKFMTGANCLMPVSEKVNVYCECN